MSDQASGGHTLSRAAVVALLATLLVRWCAAAEPQRTAAPRRTAGAPVPIVRVLGVHFFSEAKHSRVVVDLEATVRYSVGQLSNPERLYFDLSDTRIGPELNDRQIFLEDVLVRRIRIAQNQDSVTRVVLDLNSAARHTVSVLADPPRLVVDLTSPSTPEVAQPIPRRKAVGESASSIRAKAPPIPNREPVGESRSDVEASLSTSKVAQTPAVAGTRGSDLSGPEVVQVSPPRKTVRELAPKSRAKAAPMANRAPAGESRGGVGNSSSSFEVVQPTVAGTRGPDPYGNSEQPALRYAGESLTRNVLLIDFGAETKYDDNMLSNNMHRVNDVGFMFSPHFGLRRQGEHLALAFDYQPNLVIYRRVRELNSLNQGLQYDADYQFTQHFDLRTRGFLRYQTGGTFKPQVNETMLPGLGPPASLNQTVISPLANELQRDYRFDTTYKTSPRTSFTLFGGLLQRDFNHAAVTEEGLLPTDERNAGLEYRYRLSPNSTFGALYLLQDMRFGPSSRLLGHGAIVSFARQISPTFTVGVFGGPEYTRLHDRFTITSGPVTSTVPIFRIAWYGSLGGDLTKRSDNTVYQLSVVRQVTDGGGLIGAATNTLFTAIMRRRFSGRWEIIWSGGYSRTCSISSPQFAREIDSEFASFGLERSFSNSLTTRVGYEFNRQRGGGTPTVFADVDRDLVYFGIFYHFGRNPTGQ